MAVAYLRVSTEDQKLGPEAQRDAIEHFAAAQGLKVRSWHLDQGVSGAAPVDERPALLEAIAALKTGDALIVAKRDRLARDRAVVVAIEATVKKRRARILSAEGIGNEDTSHDGLIRDIFDAYSVFERRRIGERTADALQAKKRRNERVGMVPFGFKLDPTEPEDAEIRHLVPDAREQAIISRVHELRKTGLSYRRIARFCRQERLLSRGKKPLQETQIQRILRREK